MVTPTGLGVHWGGTLLGEDAEIQLPTTDTYLRTVSQYKETCESGEKASPTIIGRREAGSGLLVLTGPYKSSCGWSARVHWSALVWSTSMSLEVMI